MEHTLENTKSSTHVRWDESNKRFQFIYLDKFTTCIDDSVIHLYRPHHETKEYYENPPGKLFKTQLIKHQ